MAEYNLNRLIVPTILFTLLFFVMPASADTAWETKVVSDAGIDAIDGRISGEYIIYLGTEGFNQSMNRIYLYSVKTGEQTIIGIPDTGMTVTGQDISGGYAVWTETPSADSQNGNDEKPNRIFLYQIADGKAGALDLPGTAAWPKIAGKQIVCPDTPGSSTNVSLILYDIGTGTTRTLTEINEDADTAGIVFDGENLAWTDQKGLYIYDIGTGRSTTAFESVYGNETGSNVDSFDMNGDYLVYLKHTVNWEGPDKGTYDLPCLYILSTGETRLMDPKTAETVPEMPAAEMKLSLTSPFTDGKRVGWAYADNSPDSTIVLLDPATGDSSTIAVNGSVSRVFMEDGHIVWSESHYPSFESQLVYAEETTAGGGEEKASAPGFTAICCIAALAGVVFMTAKRR